MASSVSSDIVKALQCLKCAIQYDLLFREPGPSSIYEPELELKNDENNGGPRTEEGWDELLSDDKDTLDMGIDFDSDPEEICHVCVIVLLSNMFCLLQPAAWAKPSRSQAAIGGLGSAQCWSEPEPPKPKPGLLGQAGPEHHYP
ncbi:hypothetical protein H2248_011502 [Termitomyces sp. 'cryptogamus']|nr:hypothetical protein H2248_011502 [Termitomyces sp. 'cryptogamus']